MLPEERELTVELMPIRRICIVSDMHGYLPVIPPCDVLLICGDNAPDFALNDIGAIRQIGWYNTTFRAWLHTVHERNDAQIFGIAGNHDFGLFRHKVALDDDLPWTYLQDSGAEYEGLSLWGSPWVANCEGWAFNLLPQQLEYRFGRIPDKTDILLLHGPPYGYGDGVFGVGRFVERCGSVTAMDVISRIKPKLVAYGHIHEGAGQWRFGPTRLVNASLLDERYLPMHTPVVVTLETK